MQGKISMDLSFCQAETGFSLDELVEKVADVFATKIARIILKRFANAREWEEYWQKRMRCIGNVVVNIGNYRCVSQTSGQ